MSKKFIYVLVLFALICCSKGSERSAVSRIVHPDRLDNCCKLRSSRGVKRITTNDHNSIFHDDQWEEVLSGSVSIYVDKMRIECDTAYWFPNDSLLKVPGNVKIITDKQVLTGSELLFYMKHKSRYEIKNVVGVYKLK